MKMQFFPTYAGRRSNLRSLFLGSPAIILLAFFALGPGKANADTMTTFNATGAFQDGASLTGTLTIDTTTGTVTASTVEVPSDATGLDDIQVGLPGTVTAIDITTDGNSPELDLYLPVDNLVGYTGGPLGSLADPLTVKAITVETNLFLPTNNNAVFLNSGALTQASAVPENATYIMLATGLLLMGLYSRA
ncbi:MAG: hypothetical protein ACRD34_01645 [Bryobacteraceae bacterium]